MSVLVCVSIFCLIVSIFKVYHLPPSMLIGIFSCFPADMQLFILIINEKSCMGYPYLPGYVSLKGFFYISL